jgi:hypothetical protein
MGMVTIHLVVGVGVLILPLFLILISISQFMSLANLYIIVGAISFFTSIITTIVLGTKFINQPAAHGYFSYSDTMASALLSLGLLLDGILPFHDAGHCYQYYLVYGLFVVPIITGFFSVLGMSIERFQAFAVYRDTRVVTRKFSIAWFLSSWTLAFCFVVILVGQIRDPADTKDPIESWKAEGGSWKASDYVPASEIFPGPHSSFWRPLRPTTLEPACNPVQVDAIVLDDCSDPQQISNIDGDNKPGSMENVTTGNDNETVIIEVDAIVLTDSRDPQEMVNIDDEKNPAGLENMTTLEVSIDTIEDKNDVNQTLGVQHITKLNASLMSTEAPDTTSDVSISETSRDVQHLWEAPGLASRQARQPAQEEEEAVIIESREQEEATVVGEGVAVEGSGRQGRCEVKNRRFIMYYFTLLFLLAFITPVLITTSLNVYITSAVSAAPVQRSWCWSCR